MRSWTKYINLILCVIISTVFFLNKDSLHISTNLVSLLPDGKSKEAFEIYSQFKNSKEIFVAVDGFDKEALGKIKTIEERFLKTDLFKLESNIVPNPQLIEYSKKNTFFLRELTHEKEPNIPEKLQALLEKMATSPYYLPVDPSDPLGYLKPSKPVADLNIRDGHLALGDFGYFAIFSIKDPSNALENYEKVYEVVHKELQNMEGVRVFSPTFYFVENSKMIQNDVNFLIFLSTILLLGLYIFIIKNIYLLINTILTLVSSALFSFLLTGLIWDEVSIFVLAFGNAIGTLAIDYMFHYYFYGHYEKKKEFNTSVLYGFLTTFAGFLIFSFVEFPLIQQVCVFAMISLVLSYIQFVFIFPLIGFKKAQPFSQFHFSIPLPYRAITMVSIVAIIIALPFVKIDTNIKTLDYQNKALMKEEKFFKDAIKKEGFTPILIEASSIDELIQRSNLIKKSFKNTTLPLSYFVDKAFYQQREKELEALNLKRAKEQIEEEALKLGFRAGFFAKAYDEALLHPIYTELDMTTLGAMGFDVIYKNNTYFTYGLVKNHDIVAVQKLGFAYSIDAKEMFLNSLQKVMHQLMLGGILAMGFIASMLFLVCRKTLALSASYVLLPTALILLLAFTGTFTIAHLFMLFIMMLFGIDYGIYMSNEKSFEDGTKSAILFSIVDTFAGFGVLIFSDIGALHGMGLVSCIGTVAIFLLLMGRKSH